MPKSTFIDWLSYKRGILFGEEVPLLQPAKKYGTPIYIYSSKHIIQQIKNIKDAFAQINQPYLICYSVKANSNSSLLRLISSQGIGADVVSGGELYRCLKSGFPAKKIIYAGVGKTEEEILYGLKNNILFFTVESETELETISKIASQIKKIARISLRINPDVEADTHSHIRTGHKDTKFGISPSTAEKIVNNIQKLKNIHIVGLHAHIGSQILNIKPFLKEADILAELYRKFAKKIKTLKYLDLGGGFGIPYREDDRAFDFSSFIKKISSILADLDCCVIIEPGRYIVGNSGVLLSKVLYIKQEYNKKFIIVDAAMNDLIRPSLYNSYHHILPLKDSHQNKKFEYVDIVGPVCETGDFFAKERIFPEVKKGDIIAICSTGAYGFSMSSNYNSRTRSAEVLIEEEKFRLIRKRESLKDLIKGE